MEERRRRRIAFENLAKGMLRYLDNCNGAKVGITVMQERVEVPLQFGISIQRVAQQAMNEDNQNIFEVFLAERRRIMYCQLGQDLERRCQDLGREIQMLNKRQEVFQDAIEGKLSVQDRASERMQDRIIEERKE